MRPVRLPGRRIGLRLRPVLQDVLPSKIYRPTCASCATAQPHFRFGDNIAVFLNTDPGYDFAAGAQLQPHLANDDGIGVSRVDVALLPRAHFAALSGSVNLKRRA